MHSKRKLDKAGTFRNQADSLDFLRTEMIVKYVFNILFLFKLFAKRSSVLIIRSKFLKEKIAICLSN